MGNLDWLWSLSSVRHEQSPPWGPLMQSHMNVQCLLSSYKHMLLAQLCETLTMYKWQGTRIKLIKETILGWPWLFLILLNLNLCKAHISAPKCTQACHVHLIHLHFLVPLIYTYLGLKWHWVQLDISGVLGTYSIGYVPQMEPVLIHDPYSNWILWPAYEHCFHMRAIFPWICPAYEHCFHMRGIITRNMARIWKQCSYAGYFSLDMARIWKQYSYAGYFPLDMPRIWTSFHMQAIFNRNMDRVLTLVPFVGHIQ
jgi:hypothetical protein